MTMIAKPSRAAFACLRSEAAESFANQEGPSQMTGDEKIEFLGGQVHALMGFATALITSHQNLALLAEHLEKAGEINLATAESMPISDTYVEGVLDVKDRLRNIVGIALEQRRRPDNG
jgi:hypothetical protein